MRNTHSSLSHLESRIKDLKAFVSGLHAETRQERSRRVEVENLLAEAELGLAESEGRLAESKSRLAESKSRRAEAETEIRTLRAKIKTQQSSMKVLHDTIRQQAGTNDEPDESRLETMVRNLHYKIQSLQVNYYESNGTLLLNEMDLDPKSPMGCWEELRLMSPRSRKYNIQASIFYILDEAVFKKPCFGLAQSTEEVLQQFETKVSGAPASKSFAVTFPSPGDKPPVLRDTIGSASNVVTWRKNTVLLAKLMPEQHLLVNRVARKLCNKLLPVMTLPDDLDTDVFYQQLRDDVIDLVQAAVEVALTMRSSSKIYEIVTPMPGDPVANWHRVEHILGSNGGRNPNLHVMEVRFGALIKRPNALSTSEDEWEVLEKALVTAA